MTAADRPSVCCGVCPPIAGGGYDCTCADNPRCPRPSVTEDTRYEADRLDAVLTAFAEGNGSTATLIDAAADLLSVVRRAETTTEDVVDAARRVLAETPGGPLRPIKAAEALDAHGLLATARTRPTREQVSAAIGDVANPTQVGFGVVSIAAAVDAVLALLADQPTEAETRTATEWGVRGYRNSDRTVFFSGEDSARYEARTHGGAVIRRQVTTWPEGE